MTNKEKYLQLFRYLLDFAKLREITIRTIEEYEEHIWFEDIKPTESWYSITWDEIEDKGSNEWLKIKKPKEPLFPHPNAELNKWLYQDLLRKYDIDLQLKDEQKVGNEKTLLSDNPEILNLFAAYKKLWLKWSKEYEEYLRLLNIYKKVFSIYEKWERFGEEYEIIVGIGLLNFNPNELTQIKRHLLVASASIDFNADKGIFLITCGAEGAKLRVETDMIRDQQINNTIEAHDILEKKINELELGESPFEKEIKGLLKTFLTSLQAEGKFEDTNITYGNKTTIPLVTYSPALILRKRNTRGLAALYERIIEYIINQDEIDIPMLNDLIGVRKDIHADGENFKITNEFEEIFFPKVANDEQLEILDSLKYNSKTLVQGPPGTGKSHTIANLVCHLLAHGKNILVTAHTKRALDRLKDLLPEPVKPLCVNLLGNDKESVDDLENSVTQLLNRKNLSNPLKDAQEIDKLFRKLDSLKNEKANVENKIIKIRERDTFKYEINYKYKGTIVDIIQQIKNDEIDFAWFEDKVKILKDYELQLDYLLDFLKLYDFCKSKPNDYFTKNINFEHTLFTIDEFKSYLTSNEQLQSFDEKIEVNKPFYQKISTFSEKQLNDLQQTLILVLQQFKTLQKCEQSWSNKAITDCLKENTSKWYNVYERTQDLLTNNLKANIKRFEGKFFITSPNELSNQQLKSDSYFILQFLNDGNKIRSFKFLNKKEVKERWYLKERVFINGSPCDTIEEFSLLHDISSTELDLKLLLDIWGIEDINLSTHTAKYSEISHRKSELETIISTTQKIIELKNYINDKYLLDLKEISESVTIDLINNIAFIYADTESKKHHSLLNKLKSFIKENDGHSIYYEIELALSKNNLQQYLNALTLLDSIKIEYDKSKRLMDLTNNLKLKLPNFIEYVLNNNIDFLQFDREKLLNAFCWSNAKIFVDDFIGSFSIISLLEDLKNIDNNIFQTIGSLSALKSWQRLFQEMTLSHQQSLLAWSKAMKKAKGRGKTANKFRRVAQQQMDKCKDVIPAWIMPLYKVAESVPAKPFMYDYVIIDEASQAGVDALFLLFIAKNVIIVGDDRQTAPEYVGVEKEPVEYIIKKHLNGLPLSDYYDLNFSFYEHAQLFPQSKNSKITLREHYRCMPEIIAFSNDLFYKPFGNGLFPLKQYPENRLEPLVSVEVPNGSSEGTSANLINKTEANQIVNTIKDCLENPTYKQKTLGVISLRGKSQSNYIEKLLLDTIGPEQMKKRKIICGDSASFQGDERDIIFLSLVVARNRPFNALTSPPHQRRFNVAMSRAQEQVWLFHSINFNDLGNKEDMRYNLLKHFYTYKKLEPISEGYKVFKELQEIPKSKRTSSTFKQPFESWFEVDIYEECINKHYSVIPQYEVGHYRIDLAVVLPNGTKIAIECDGDKYHGIEEYQKDIARQKVLERCGWQFFRVRGCEYYNNKHESLLPLWDLLDKNSSQIDAEFTSEYTNIDQIIKSDLREYSNEISKDSSLQVPFTISEKNIILNEVEDKDVDLIKWFKETNSQMWFEASNNGKLDSFEKAMIFGIGLKVQKKETPSVSQLKKLRNLLNRIENS